jgi:hypothetical protein
MRLCKQLNQRKAQMLKGSCACGQISYEISGNLIGPVSYCHCWRCRKHSGSSFGTTAGVQAAQFEVVSGKELLSHWTSSPGIRRYFASCCGSPIYKIDDSEPDEVRFRLGTLDTDPGVTVERHYMALSKAPWVRIEDSLVQDASGPPFGTRD